jgi:hypothetical protein
MLSFIWRARIDVPEVGDEVLDALLTADLTPAETTAALRPVADVVAAVRFAPSAGELAGLDGVLAEFRAAGSDAIDLAPAWVRGAAQGRRAARPGWLRSLSLKVAGAVVVAVLGGGIAAAYAGALPASLQKFAHRSIGAPAAHASPRPHKPHHPGAARLPVGPNPAGPAAHGLCTAYAHASAHGPATQRAVAFRNLAAAAGGQGNVAAFCGTAPRPGAGAGARAKAGAGPRDKPHGKPVSHPGRGPVSRPSHTPPGQQKGKAATG